MYSSSFRPSPVDKFRLGILPESWRLRDFGVWISQDIININKHANHDSVHLKQIFLSCMPNKTRGSQAIELQKQFLSRGKK